MSCYSFYHPTDAQIDQLLLNSAASGRLSSKDLDMLLDYIRVMRNIGSRHGHYITPRDKTAAGASGRLGPGRI